MCVYNALLRLFSLVLYRFLSAHTHIPLLISITHKHTPSALRNIVLTGAIKRKNFSNLIIKTAAHKNCKLLPELVILKVTICRIEIESIHNLTQRLVLSWHANRLNSIEAGFDRPEKNSGAFC